MDCTIEKTGKYLVQLFKKRYFTMTDDEIDPKYYQDNYYCTRMMMDALKYLYAHADEFPEMLGAAYMGDSCRRP